MLADLLEKIGADPARGKPVVGTSACLLGRAVRYNGETKYHAATAEALEQWVALREFCPEVGIGLPVPRPPIQVVRVQGEQRVRGIEHPDRDFTAALHDYADTLPDALDGFVLKARSPSCGLDSTPLMDEEDREIAVTSGVFAARLRVHRPGLPLCDEETLETEAGRETFLLRAWLYRQGRDPDGRPSVGRIHALAQRLPEPARAPLRAWLSSLR